MIIDTSAYSALQNGSAEVSWAISSADRLLVPLVVVGELRYGFMNGSRPTKNEEALQKFLATNGIEVVGADLETTSHYAFLYTQARQKGRALSHNDLWIAALARQHSAPLLTLDKDFEVLRPVLPGGLILV